jgi:hypothetical protein
MSVLNNFILVCEYLDEKAYIYELDSGELWDTSKVHVLPNNSFKLPANAYQYERVVDAELIDDYLIIWILYSGGDNYHVVVTTFNGSVVRVCTKHFKRPQYISFSPYDKFICIMTFEDYDEGIKIRVSDDKGEHWKTVLTFPESNITVLSVIRMTQFDSENSYTVYCTLEQDIHDTKSSLVTYVQSKTSTVDQILDTRKVLYETNVTLALRGALSKTILTEDGRGNIYILNEGNFTIHHFVVKLTNLEIAYRGIIQINKNNFCSICVNGKDEVLYVGYNDVVEAYKLTYMMI